MCLGEYLVKAFKNLSELELYLNSQFVPQSKHTVSAIKVNKLMLCGTMVAVCSVKHTAHTNAFCRWNIEF